MAKKVESFSCGGCMCKMCSVMMGGILVIVGAVVLANQYIGLADMIENTIEGGGILIVGASVIVHAMGMCPMCKC